MKTNTYLLRLGEVTLKKRNRNWFINNLVRIIKPRVRHLDAKLEKRHKKLLLYTEAPADEVRKALKTVFGLVGVSPIFKTTRDMEDIKKTALELVKPHFESQKSFSVKAKRTQKTYPVKSPDIQRQVAEYLFEHGLNLKVDLKHSELTLLISVEFKETWLSLETWPCLGGLPVSSKNKFGLLLSGGIDSPVAGNLIQKRGGYLEAVYFHTPPFTVESAKDKVIDLAEILSRYQNGFNLHIVNFTEVMKTIKANCHDSLMVVLSRRFMMRVAERIMTEKGGQALVTGESLGQVASQTIENISIANSVVTMPVLRPLIGMDKTEIISWSRKIDAYETSIRPYEDCCSLFAPEEPATRASARKVQHEESKLDINGLVERALEQTESIRLCLD
ncbi:MAG: tRNA 4-thiouridine(8) synthase ThiI [Acidobacteria bacterium]|nr:MAG: tRNA 4-thiouridine(8) synthase ThiI [Acidobacteriota bacterium]